VTVTERMAPLLVEKVSSRLARDLLARAEVYGAEETEKYVRGLYEHFRWLDRMADAHGMLAKAGENARALLRAGNPLRAPDTLYNLKSDSDDAIAALLEAADFFEGKRSEYAQTVDDLEEALNALLALKGIDPIQKHAPSKPGGYFYAGDVAR
jgi:hypothetical protein